MKTDFAEIAEAALNLPTDEKARLAQQLLTSMDTDDVEERWEAEIARRVTMVREGTASLVTSDEVDRRIRSILAR